jgi:CheY-like chemotaxis protein
MVRRLTHRILEEWGYRVLCATNGQEALKVWSENKQDIQILLTDVVMPKMNGYDLVRLLLAQQANLKVIFMSGYTDQMVEAINAEGEKPVFLQKPFTLQDLAKQLRKVMGSSG